MSSMEEQRAEKFYELRQNGSTVEEIATTYFLSVRRVQQIIKDYERAHQITHTTARKRIVTKTRKGSDSRDLRAKEFRDLKLKGATLEDIGSMYGGLTRERVRQIIHKYELKYNLPSSTHVGKELAKKARQADIEERTADKKRDRQLQSEHFVETVQLDANLVGHFIQALGDRGIYYRYYAKYSKRKSDGAAHPGGNNPTHIAFYPGKANMVTLHSWVLDQYSVEVPQEHHCHHIDSDITNNMFENLQVISNVEHGRITIQEQKAKGTFNFHNPNTKRKRLTVEQVEEIRRTYIPRVTIVSELESRYGVKQATLYNAIYGWGAYRNVSPETIRRKNPQPDGQLTLDFDA